MAHIPRNITGVADMHVRYQYDGQQCENVWSFHWTGSPPSTADLQNLISEWLGHSQTALLALYPSQVLFNSIYARDVDQSHPDAEYTYFFPANTLGSRGTSGDSANKAVSAVLQSGIAGRAHHGRKSFSPLAQSDNIMNEVSTLFMQLVINFLATLVTSYVTGKFQPVIASQKYNGWDIIRTVGIPNNTIDSQKTRLTGRGR